jgi:hypothetical protein
MTPPPATGGVTLTLDIPNSALDPMGYSEVDVTLHEPTGDIVRTSPVDTNGVFDLGEIDPADSVWVEASLRTESGTAVGYGRTAIDTPLAAGDTIVVPIRRPIVYVAGLFSKDTDSDPTNNNDHWTTVPATFADLSTSTPLDGTTTVGTNAVVMVSAGPELFMVEQATSDPNGTMMGAASIQPVSTGDHMLSAALAGTMQGGVLDGAGTDDGGFLVIGTTTQLFVVDTTSGSATMVAPGSFSRLTIVNHGDGTSTAFAIKGRGDSTKACGTTAEIDAVDLATGMAPSAMRMVATGGFTDVASDANKAYYVDCQGELGEITDAGLHPIKTGLGYATALAASNGQAYIGVETIGVDQNMNTTTAAQVQVLASALNASETGNTPRTLFSESREQVVEASDLPGVQRALLAHTAVFGHLEVGAGGDYIAISLESTFDGQEIIDANFPQMSIETDEMYVFDAATGGIVQRYRSWCDGILFINPGDITKWGCATSAGQSAPADGKDHHIGSMTFLFGRK